jgi:hypothetical protein
LTNLRDDSRAVTGMVSAILRVQVKRDQARENRHPPGRALAACEVSNFERPASCFLTSLPATDGGGNMVELADFQRRAAEIRKVARGIFDKKERKLLLDFLADLENLVAKPGRQGNGSMALERLASRDAAIFDALPDD